MNTRDWLALPRAERDTRVAAYHTANNALQDYRSPDRTEDDTYLDLNDQVAALSPTVPWWVSNPAVPSTPGELAGLLIALAVVVTLAIWVTSSGGR